MRGRAITAKYIIEAWHQFIQHADEVSFDGGWFAVQRVVDVETCFGTVGDDKHGVVVARRHNSAGNVVAETVLLIARELHDRKTEF